MCLLRIDLGYPIVQSAWPCWGLLLAYWGPRIAVSPASGSSSSIATERGPPATWPVPQRICTGSAKVQKRHWYHIAIGLEAIALEAIEFGLEAIAIRFLKVFFSGLIQRSRSVTSFTHDTASRGIWPVCAASFGRWTARREQSIIKYQMHVCKYISIYIYVCHVLYIHVYTRNFIWILRLIDTHRCPWLKPARSCIWQAMSQAQECAHSCETKHRISTVGSSSNAVWNISRLQATVRWCSNKWIPPKYKYFSRHKQCTATGCSCQSS